METLEELQNKYINEDMKLVDKNGKRHANGAVTAVYQYGELIVFAVWDMDEPMAWAGVYQGDGKLLLGTELYTIEIVPFASYVAPK